MTQVAVAVLCTCKNSAYAQMAGVQCYGQDRDARTFVPTPNVAVVAHPPCRTWGKLKHFAKAPVGEMELAPMCVDIVRACGGVLEHPLGSRLWSHCHLPKPNAGVDAHGGWTLLVDLFDWGFKARKPTLLYIVGVSPREMPPVPPPRTDAPTHSIAGNVPGTLGLPQAQRERTPPAMARWLVCVARTCKAKQRGEETAVYLSVEQQ